MSVSINIGTRGRPEALKFTLENTLPHMTRKDTKVLISIDDDDAETIAAIDTLPKDDRLIFSVKPREDNRGAKSDRVLTEAPADIYMVAHDAVPIITPGWDQWLYNAGMLFPDGIGVINTQMANASFPIMQGVTRKWVEIVGHIYTHEYPFWFIDHELDDLCRMTGRGVYVAIHCEHVSTRPSKTIRMRDVAFWADYYDASIYRRRATAAKIIDALDEPAWRKRMLKTWYHPVESRSLNINYGVKQDAVRIEEHRGERGPPDPGYLRTFHKAREQLKLMQQEIRESGMTHDIYGIPLPIDDECLPESGEAA
jgi:hypothetical protein